MTCCIAAICEADAKIVTASDQKLDFGQFSIDGVTVKNEPIYPDWSMQISATDVGALWPMFSYTKRILCANLIEERAQKRIGKSANRVRDAVRDAYGTLRGEAAEAQILSAYNLDMETFLRDGRSKFGEAMFRSICKRIEKVWLGEFDLLISGFDSSGEAHLQTFGHDGVSRDWDATGFYAVGSGSPSALEILSFHSYNRMSSLEECVYRVCEAKFMAQRASGVGEKTFVYVFGPGPEAENRKYILESDTEEIKSAWRDAGCPRTPPEIIKKIPGMVLTLEESIKREKEKSLMRSTSQKSA
jgi:20S proteasome alpha/beta subunit